jgi:hypothetical protein
MKLSQHNIDIIAEAKKVIKLELHLAFNLIPAKQK